MIAKLICLILPHRDRIADFDHDICLRCGRIVRADR